MDFAKAMLSKPTPKYKTMTIIKYLSCTLFLLLPFGLFSQINWDEYPIVKGLGAYNDLRVADLDDDGDLDILVSTEAWVAWFENVDGQGQFSLPHYLFDGEEELIFAVDIDLDGDLDIVLERGVLIKTNGLNQWTYVQEFNAYDPLMDVADYNADGYPDIVRKDGNIFNLALNDQTGSFGQETEMIVTPATSSYVFFADVNQDGQRDLIYGDNTDLLLYKNEGGIFTAEPVASGDFSPASFNVGDFDLDNDLEIMVVNNASDEVRFYSKSTTAWAPGTLIANTSISYTRNVALSDFDMDGDLDLLLDINSGEVIWFKNDNGVFSNFMEFPNWFGPDDQVLIRTGDFSGDGNLDFVSFHNNPVSGNPFLTWYHQSNNELIYKPVTINVQEGLSQFKVADLNGDGEAEVIVRSKSITTLENNGNGVFSAGQILSSNNKNTEILVEDWDGDGDMDVFGLFASNQLAWKQNDGQGNFTSMVVVSTLTINIGLSVDIGDLDNDGDLDVISSSEVGTGGSVRWYENIDNQSFTGQTISSLGSGSKLVRLSDYDHDNDLDILVYSSSSNFIEVIQNLGNGNFAEKEILKSNLPTRWNTMILEDLTGDGHEDIIFSTSPFSGTGQVAYYPNQMGSYGAQYTIASFGSSGSANYTYGAPADMDGDGDLDMLYAASYEDGFGVKINNGAGIFEDDFLIFSGDISADTILTLSHPFAIDMNGDDKLDPVVFYYYACGGCFIPSSRVQNLSWFDNILGEIPPTFINELSAVTCNINNTVSDPTDDYLEFDLLVTNGLSGNYIISANGINIASNQGIYEELTHFKLPAGVVGTGDITIEIIDQVNPNFTSSILLNNPDFCEDFMPAYISELSAFDCQDNDTNQDPTDDYITFDLNLSAQGLSGNYSISNDNYAISPTQGSYGENISFALSTGSAGIGDLSVSIVDVNNANFTSSFTVNDPGTCSDFSPVFISKFSTFDCQDNGTNQDPTDDYITFDLNLSAQGLSGNYFISNDNYAISPTQGSYGENISFELSTGSAGTGNLPLSIIDVNNANFTTSLTASDPGTCSDFQTSVNTPTGLQAKIHPNPFNGNLQIHLSTYTKRSVLKFRLSSIDGKPVYSQNLTKNDMQLLIPNLVNGLYLYEIIDARSKEVLARGRLVHQ